MSRSDYENDDGDNWSFIKWRGQVASAMRGKRGQMFFLELIAALDALPEKKLVKDELEAPTLISCGHWGMFETQSVCAIGAVGKMRGTDMSRLDPYDHENVGHAFGIPYALASEIAWVNDKDGPRHETPEARWARVRAWAVKSLKDFIIPTPPVSDAIGRGGE